MNGNKLRTIMDNIPTRKELKTYDRVCDYFILKQIGCVLNMIGINISEINDDDLEYMYDECKSYEEESLVSIAKRDFMEDLAKSIFNEV